MRVLHLSHTRPGMNLSLMAGIAYMVVIFGLTAPPSRAKEKGCMDAKCHAKTMGKKKWVHGPVAAEACDACHVALPKKKHKFKLAAQDAELCYGCHDAQNTGKNIHPPVEAGECISCHNPHESDNQFNLIAPSGPELCFTCHEDDKTKQEYVHGPVAVGECAICHEPHSSPNPSLLRTSGNELCFECHTEIQEALGSNEYVHPPAEDSCLNCHDPHGSPVQFQLETKTNLRDLCFTCHEEKKQDLTLPVQHGAVTQGKECANCHNPHAGKFAAMLKLEPMDLCLSCHNRPVQADDRPLQDIAKLLKENPDHHGPIRQKDCSGCHSPHGSKYFRLLNAVYPKKFYAPFKLENFALCFTCHEEDNVLEEKTTKLTNFRNGDRNLHFLHVNRVRKGRTCRACHETHASTHSKHIRDAVPFGKWSLPLNFKTHDTGGSCKPGCHKEKTYDRIKPVQY